MNNFKIDQRENLQRISCGLQWENKPPKLKRSIEPQHLHINYSFSLFVLDCVAS